MNNNPWPGDPDVDAEMDAASQHDHAASRKPIDWARIEIELHRDDREPAA